MKQNSDCTSEGHDEYETGSKVACCEGLTEHLFYYNGQNRYFCFAGDDAGSCDCLCAFDVDRTLTAI